MKTRFLLLLPLAVAAVAAVSRADEAPLPNNVVEALEAKLQKGEIKFSYAADGHGYLKNMLEALKISPDSQVLPFTKSSLQFDRISPGTPRAVYFNDDVAVGAVHPGGLIEIIANDRRGGIVFYTLDNKAPGTPQIINPAHPFDLTDQTRPFEDRWGGWYVTGKTENMHHLGNTTAPDPAKPFDLPEGRTLASLSGRFYPAHALKPSSDIVALMTLEHQTGFINRLFAMNARYSDAALEDMVTYMTFGNEEPLPGPIAGDSGFAADFAKRGPNDSKGRSLRSFDLATRLFRYPLSYMVYSTAFGALKPDIRDKLYRRLYDVLKAKGADGADAIAILAATKQGLPDYWK